MPTTSPTSQGSFRGLAKRYGARAAIIAVGAAFAVGTLKDTHFLPKPTLVEQPFADVMKPKVNAAVKPWAILDAGEEHSRITSWIERLTSAGSRRGVEQTLGKKMQYEGMIRAKLEAAQMPADLIYLAMIESNFNPNATSPVKAKGMWQFMAATAREFGLAVSGRTDERTDPAKATDAALAYLQQLKNRFGSWYLAAAAYNSGGGTVSKALRNTTGRTTGTDEDFWLIMPRLPKETQDYVPKLIATARIGNDPVKYGLKVQEAGGVIDLSAVRAAPPRPAKVDKVKTRVTPKILKKSTVKRPAVKKPTVKTPTAKKATAKKPTVKKPAVKPPAATKTTKKR